MREDKAAYFPDGHQDMNSDGVLAIMQRIADGPERGRELRKVLREAKRLGYSMDDLTVLSHDNDPYRFDTEASHRNGQWFAEQVNLFLPEAKTLHFPGL